MTSRPPDSRSPSCWGNLGMKLGRGLWVFDYQSINLVIVVKGTLFSEAGACEFRDVRWRIARVQVYVE